MEELRNRIDEIDKEMTRLFAARMDLVAEIAAYKCAHHLPILDSARERDKLNALVQEVPAELAQPLYSFYHLLFALSRSEQGRRMSGHSARFEEIQTAIQTTAPLFPPSASVACQGVEGAYSQLACTRLFPRPQILYFKTFESVFSAIESGLCAYGVLPLENSTAGSVTKVYDLMLRHQFKIVRSVRMKVDHNLVAKPGTKREDIREIFSHEQALSQCSAFLEQFPGVTVTQCANTAAAAAAVAQSARNDVAAIASHSCLALYGLSCLAADIQDRSNNYTRFICISKRLEVYPGADKTSIMMVLPHQPGALHQVLSRFAALGLNLIKLESRPLPDRDFEFMFYFDLETSIYSDEFLRLLDDLDRMGESFHYLGSYSEVI